MQAVRSSEPSMLDDFITAQKAMPGLQKTGINPHFGNKYVPLEQLIEKVLPVLNEHGFALVQLPTVLDGHPALETRLVHYGGETISATMLLLCAKDDPQGQGSAITYARRYSLMSLLGLSADQDDDAEATRKAPVRQSAPAAQIAVQRQRMDSRIPERDDVPTPSCPEHGPLKYVAGGTSKATGRAYSAFWSCTRDCGAGNKGRGYTVDADGWYAQNQPSTPVDYDANDLPQE
jgi:ERF superfamily protein